MEDKDLKYYCDDTLKNEDVAQWNYLLDYAFAKADAVEFNILYTNSELPEEIKALLSDLIERGEEGKKIYPSGEYLRFKLTKKVKDFIKSKQNREWYNYFLEDISFLKENKEFLATVTHENQIVLQATRLQIEEWNKHGFNFSSDWGIDPVQHNN